ncbi:hypothetical protein GCK72_016593 [Caenorhabditis remanei]|uniref:F-box domain-containing protein n=1 Tax=Caenorhabditis remanei TaxID=31234 RepID=A0A6A5G4W3_CAERE|nr:hypothetical protein GCK72_016593 [Caenorhabditis remanei]KAF1750048.1 hypothetical protein GCK72_016593 [Caenorhabditis remanei]
MKLLKFPSLVQQQIFGFIEFNNLLVLSFCSKRTRYLIQSLQRYQWMNIKFVKYSIDENDKIYVSVRSETINGFFILSPITPKQPVITPMDVFGMGPEIPICVHPRYFGNQYLYDKEQKHLVVHGIHDYLYAFFGSSIDYEVESVGNELPPSLKNINRTCINVPKNTTAEELEACFTASPNQEYIEIDGHFNGILSTNSVIYGAKHLRVYFKGNHGDEILLRFRGARLQFHSTKFHDSTISQFLKEWKSNQGFQNLKSLSIGSDWKNNYNAPKLLKDIDVKQLDQAEDIVHISWQMSCSYYRPERLFSELPSKSGKVGFDYLIRDGDGEKASVFIEDHDVCFALWKGNSSVMETIDR